jgi:hypothetical protein
MTCGEAGVGDRIFNPVSNEKNNSNLLIFVHRVKSYKSSDIQVQKKEIILVGFCIGIFSVTSL